MTIFLVLPLSLRPVEPSLVRERMDILDDRVKELRALAADRKRRLDDNKRLCQFWWDLADLENNFREQEQVLALTDTGRDIVSVNRLLAKHRNAETNLESLGRVLGTLEGQVSGQCKVFAEICCSMRLKYANLGRPARPGEHSRQRQHSGAHRRDPWLLRQAPPAGRRSPPHTRRRRRVLPVLH